MRQESNILNLILIRKLSPTGLLFLAAITIISFMSLDANAFTDTSANSSEISSLILSNSTWANSSMLYNDNDLGFNIRFPADWRSDSTNSEHQTVISFDSPESDATVDIRVFPQDDFKSIKEVGDKQFKESKEQTLLGYYRNKTTLLSERPAFKAIYLTTSNPSLFEGAFGYKSSTSKAMMIATLVPEKNSIYALTYFATPAHFDNFLPTIEKMIGSFKIYGKGPVIQEDNSSSTSD